MSNLEVIFPSPFPRMLIVAEVVCKSCSLCYRISLILQGSSILSHLLIDVNARQEGIGVSPPEAITPAIHANRSFGTCPGEPGLPVGYALRRDVPTLGACLRCAETDWDVFYAASGRLARA